MKNKKIKKPSPVAKAVATGEHGPAARQRVHKSKKKYTRKKKHKGRSLDLPLIN